MGRSCGKFADCLDWVAAEEIATRAALMEHTAEYSRFWFAVKEFVAFAARSRGNLRKIDLLEYLGAATRADIEEECMLRIIEKLDLVLCQIPEKRKNYCYAIVNSQINGYFRKLPAQILSLDAVLDGENGCTLGELVGDDRYNGEVVLMRQETLAMLTALYRKQQTDRKTEDRSRVLRGLIALSGHPGEAMVYLCGELGMKSGAIVDLLSGNDLLAGCDKVLSEVAKRFAISRELLAEVIELPAAIRELRLDSDREKATTRVYHLKCSAKKRITKELH